MCLVLGVKCSDTPRSTLYMQTLLFQNCSMFECGSEYETLHCIKRLLSCLQSSLSVRIVDMDMDTSEVHYLVSETNRRSENLSILVTFGKRRTFQCIVVVSRRICVVCVTRIAIVSDTLPWLLLLPLLLCPIDGVVEVVIRGQNDMYQRWQKDRTDEREREMKDERLKVEGRRRRNPFQLSWEKQQYEMMIRIKDGISKGERKMVCRSIASS